MYCSDEDGLTLTGTPELSVMMSSKPLVSLAPAVRARANWLTEAPFTMAPTSKGEPSGRVRPWVEVSTVAGSPGRAE